MILLGSMIESEVFQVERFDGPRNESVNLMRRRQAECRKLGEVGKLRQKCSEDFSVKNLRLRLVPGNPRFSIKTMDPHHWQHATTIQATVVVLELNSGKRMDDMNNAFGRLSTNAAEWRPGGAAPASSSSSSQHSASDLQANKVKEFVPGRGWSSSSAPAPAQNQSQQQTSPSGIRSTQSASSATGAGHQVADDYNQLPETTVPAGQTPPPLPSFRSLHSLSLGDDLWRHYRDLSLEETRQMDPSDQRHKAIPPPYCNAYCLDDDSGTSSHHNRQGSYRSSAFGYPCTTFRVANREDGHLYCLHRFDSVRCVSPKIAAAVSDRWSSSSSVQEHPGVVPFYHCFLTQRAVFFVHQYIPGSLSLKQRIVMAGQPLAEPVLWSCITQLVSALRTIHGCGLAVRSLDAAHVLSTADSTASRLRIRINCLGVVDALEFEARKHVSDLQQQDIRDLGLLILSLATGTDVTERGVEKETVASCAAFVAQNFSRELHHLALCLYDVPRPPGIAEVSRAVYQHTYQEQDAAYRALDRTEHALAAEYESSRALRLLLKLGFVNERPEFGPNRRWSQSGDCYVLTLFRDYGKNVDGFGRPGTFCKDIVFATSSVISNSFSLSQFFIRPMERAIQ